MELPSTILFLAANPFDTTRLALDREMREIQQRLRNSELRDAFRIQQEWAVRASDLQDCLLRHRPTLIHFSGHGSSAGELLLEDATGSALPVTTPALAGLFRILRRDIRCVLLNACFSEAQAKAIAAHVDCVVGMTTAIADTSAIAFAGAFYQALGYGEDVHTAFELGCIQLKLIGLGGADVPRLICGDGVRPQDIRLSDASCRPSSQRSGYTRAVRDLTADHVTAGNDMASGGFPNAPRHCSPNTRLFPEGFFRKIDTMHLHIDGGVALPLVEAWAQRFNEREIPTKITHVSRFSRGPQREELKETYDIHTPGVDHESLEYFTTSLLDPNKHDIPTLVEETLVELEKTKGIVVELERVMAVVSDDIVEQRSAQLRSLQGAIRFDTRKTFRIEIHYLVDIMKGPWDNKDTLSLDAILKMSVESGIDVGGWFLFERPDIWAYRSNSFTPMLPKWDELNTKRLRLQRELVQAMGCAPSDVSVKVLVEESVGVWKTPAIRLAPFKTVPELAEWEDETRKSLVEPPLRAFWVVTPNFLGDKREEIQRAMVQNLATDVKYTYFLRSFADLQRWQKFRSDLKRKHDHIQRAVDRNMAAILIQAADHNQPDVEECFIRNPCTNVREGYRLIRGKNGEVTSGLPLSHEKTRDLVSSLEPLEREAHCRRWTWLPIARDGRQFQAYVIITDLEDSKLGHDEERLLREYDLIIAEEVSKHGGEVTKSLFDGYVLVFDDEREDRGGRIQQVLRCADRIARLAVGARLPHQRILIDHDNVRRVIRSHGYDTVSAAITRGRFLLDKTAWNYVTVSNKVKTKWESLCSDNSSSSFGPSVMDNYWHLMSPQ